MTAQEHATSVATLLAGLGRTARLLGPGDPLHLEARVSGAVVWGLHDEPHAGDVALVCNEVRDAAELDAALERLGTDDARVLIVTRPDASPTLRINSGTVAHVVIDAPGINPAEVVLLLAGDAVPHTDVTTRRLTALQRSLTQVLGESDPIIALLNRLKSTCNATAALVDKHGRMVHATGPLPLSSLFDAIRHTEAETQQIDIDGWAGVADRIHDTTQDGGLFGWLLVTSRRTGFPDTYDVSAVHVAAALVEASQRMTAVTRQQERAVRAAVLEEALALSPAPAAPELSGRIASLGLSWDEQVRVVVIRAVGSGPSKRAKPALRDATKLLVRALDDATVPNLVSMRDKFAVLLTQGSPGSLRRAAVSAGGTIPGVLVGVGRTARTVGEVSTSFDDAQLAIQTLRRSGRRAGFMSYEDFDFATRLFSDVGSARMTKWAREFLRPLQDREPLLDGLRQFFEHDQNMNAASDALNIHHNSLRYRLAKVEELLQINLRDPGAVASMFLALAALDLEQVNAQSTVSRDMNGQPADIEAPRSVRDAVSPKIDANLGVVFGPDRR